MTDDTGGYIILAIGGFVLLMQILDACGVINGVKGERRGFEVTSTSRTSDGNSEQGS